MRTLIACEESQSVTYAFRRRGHEAYSYGVSERKLTFRYREYRHMWEGS